MPDDGRIYDDALPNEIMYRVGWPWWENNQAAPTWPADAECLRQERAVSESVENRRRRAAADALQARRDADPDLDPAYKSAAWRAEHSA